MTLYLAFWRGKGRPFRDRFVRLWSRSEFSHVEIVRPGLVPRDGVPTECIGATVVDGNRVRRKEIAFTPGRWDYRRCDWVEDAEAVWQRAEAELGCPYDFVGLALSHFFNSGRQVDGRWFCSELAAHGLGLEDPQVYSPGGLHRTVRLLNAVHRAGGRVAPAAVRPPEPLIHIPGEVAGAEPEDRLGDSVDDDLVEDAADSVEDAEPKTA